MTDISHDATTSKLDPCDKEIFTFARQISIAGGVLMFSGALGLVATMSQTTWDAPHILFIAMVGIGPCGLVLGNRLIRILMKHRRTDLSILDISKKLQS